MLTLTLLFVCILGATVVPTVMAAPSRFYAVELMSCRSELIAEECASSCYSIQLAQKCNRGIACTCSAAQPSMVQFCMQCLYGETFQTMADDTRSLVSSRLDVYSHLCTGNPLIGGSPVAANDTAARTGPRIRSRELTDSGCIYGLPDIAKTSPFTVIGLQSPLWPILAFITAGVLRLWMRSPS